MLTSIYIRDFVLIDEVSLSLKAGLTALTGETGAGKSILLDALGVGVGVKSARAAIRKGAKQGVVALSFEPSTDHEAWKLLEENGIPTEDDQLFLRRIQLASGKSRAFLNDQPVSLSLLRSVGETLLEVHGQHDGRSFLSVSAHRALLDEYGGLQTKVEAVTSCWRELVGARDALVSADEDNKRTAGEIDYLEFTLNELLSLNPETGEEERLANLRADMISAEKVATELSAAARLLAGEGVEENLSICARRISKAAGSLTSENEALERAATGVEAALSEVLEAKAAIETAAADLEFDQQALDQAEERLFALRRAARKHGVSVDDLAKIISETQARLAALSSADEKRAALQAKVESLETNYRELADKLSEARLGAAKQLERAVAKELAPLKLGAAQFSVSLNKIDDGGPNGFDQVEFVVATNPGVPAGPLRKIASGGELSRFVLAMKAALAAKESRTVIIFDEVDSGVGGAVANAVGERLRRLASDAQVLVVTHSPQVAAHSDCHWRVEKHQQARITKTNVVQLGDKERVEEIARMLSGAKVTTQARAAATTLLENSCSPVAADKPRKKKPVQSVKPRSSKRLQKSA
ncbi:MAG: DNA repair protein RecN [Pseudomonadota bacterium]